MALPRGGPRVLALAGKLGPQVGAGWLVCLHGEAVLDLPQGDFVRLRSGESFFVPPGWSAVPCASETVLLLAAEGQ